jgi:uncharacterized cupin superfamily protein
VAPPAARGLEWRRNAVELGPGVFVSKASEEAWEPDPDVGGEMNVLYRGGGVEAGLSRFSRPAEPIRWTLPAKETFFVLEGAARVEIADGPTLEVGVGDMASIPEGAETTWYLTTPFEDFYVLG